MTVIEIIDKGARATDHRRCELVWDLPNQTATLSEVLGRNPLKGERPSFEALARYVAAAAGLSPAAATVFLNVRNKPDALQSFVTHLRCAGFGVFARPQVDGSDIDDDLVAHVRSVAGDLGHLLIGTHDKELLQRCVGEVSASCRITVLGFEESSSWALTSKRVEFVDLGAVPGFLSAEIPRMVLRSLPPGGAFAGPLAPLGGTRRAVA